MTLAATSPLGTDLTTRYMCARSDWTYDTIYRNYATSTSSTALSSTAATSGPTSTTSTSEPTSSTSPTSSDNGGSSISGGAIAGIVIGCVAAIFLLAVFLLYRYRVWPFSKKQASISELPVSTQPQGIDEVHEIGSSGSAGKKSNTVYEIGTSGH
ncbi:hypothetical protein N7508_003473 [Penicillium antarcticum]|uniref:uncharacterized protein n=1 Tax=Penicillium antarcticum TaxID=416450 RepID=UPI00239E4939|nr:uncharacterized protein N7508_003473 [Penicillium antarcticum]KAJ5312643.1 hypothetical protein N7508_003473 [Penicillium antarcticum]